MTPEEEIEIEAEAAAARKRKATAAATPEEEIEIEAEAAAARKRKATAAAPAATLSEQRGEAGYADPESLTGTAVRGFGEGASLGFSDEINGLTEAGAALARRYPALSPLVAMANPIGTAGRAIGRMAAGASEPEETQAEARKGLYELLHDKYLSGRNQVRDENAAAQLENPKMFGAAELAGSIAAPMPGPGKLTPGVTMAGRGLQYAKSAAPIGAAAALGHSTESDPVELLKDTAGGAAMAAGGAAVLGPTVERLAVRKIVPWLDEKANNAFLKATTPAAGLTNRLKEFKNDAALQRLAKSGRELGIVKPFQKAGAALENLEGQITDMGQQIGDTARNADKAAESLLSKTGDDSAIYNPQRTRIALRQHYIDRAGTQMERNLVEPTQQELLAQIGEAGPGNQSYAQAWQNKSQMQKNIGDYARAPGSLSLKQDMLNSGVSTVKSDILAQMENAVGPDEVDSFRKTLAKYGPAKKFEELLRERTTREAAHQTLRPKDMQAGEMLGDITGISALKPVGAGLSGLARGRVDSTVYSGLNAMSKYRPGGNISRLAGAVGNESEEDSNQWSKRTSEEENLNAFDSLSRYLGRPPKDKQDAANTHFVKGQMDPDYQRKMSGE